MTGGQTASLIFSLIMIVMLIGSLASRKLAVGQTVKMSLAWVAIFAVGLVLFSFREEAGQVMASVSRQLNPQTPVQTGGEVRILRGEDGHFTVRAQVNGHTVPFMVDTGATTSALSVTSAATAGVEVSDSGFGVAVETANGTAMMRRARIENLEIGSIKREDFPVLVSDAMGDTNLLGMNFLSSLTSWRVEGKELVLVS